MPDYRLQAVRVFTRDFDKALAFYTSRVGLRPSAVEIEEEYAVFPVGEAVLVVEAVNPDNPEAEDLVGRFVGASLSVSNVQEFYDELRGRGVRFTGSPVEQSWGGILAHFHDPDDNVLTLVQLI